MTNFEGLQQELKIPKTILITAHTRPDADALGSSLALKGYFEKKGHHVDVIMPTIYPSFLDWMKGNNDVIIYENETEKSKKIISKADLIFCLDFNSLSRIGDMADPVRESNSKKVLIDHHLEPEDFADYVMSDTSSAATAVLIHRLIDMFGDNHLIDQPIGECIYAGIMTDTGSFRFPSTNKAVHLILADLLDKGTDHTKVHRLIYDANTEDRLRFLGFCLSEKLTVLPSLHTAYIALTSEELKRYKVQTGDTEGVVNYALSIKGIVFAAMFKEDAPYVKMSFRSKGNFNVNELARAHFNGGGHKNAAGGRVENSIEGVLSTFNSLVPEVKEQLEIAYQGLEQ